MPVNASVHRKYAAREDVAVPNEPLWWNRAIHIRRRQHSAVGVGRITGAKCSINQTRRAARFQPQARRRMTISERETVISPD